MTLPTFMLKIIAFFQAIISFFTSGIFWTEVTTPSDPVVIPPPENAVVLDLDNFTLTWSDEFDGSTCMKWTRMRKAPWTRSSSAWRRSTV